MSTTDENPLLEGLRLRRTPDPCALVIFGASGDLTRRKLFPALYSLAVRSLLPERFGIVGVARTEQTTKQWIADMKKGVAEHGRDELRADVWRDLAEGMRYVATDFADDRGEDAVVEALRDLDEKRGTGGNRLYYLAVPPVAFETIVNELGERRSADGWTRLIVEKPFGHDRDSARALNAILSAHFAEEEVFRIDHYLGKETVQNMLALRFANGIFEPIWNRQFIDHVQITVAESIGVEGRAGFYESAGAIRDIFQNHLLQLVALTAMEPPIDFTADSVRNEKVKVLRSLHTPGPKSVVRGQYGPGFVEGEEVPGYRDEKGVASGSNTETYVAAKLYVDNWRWADTPFYVRAGKRLAAARDDDRDPVPARSASALRGDRRRRVAPERASDPRAAGRGRLARDRREGAGRRDVDPDRAHGLSLRRRLPNRAAGGLRAADPRRDAGGCDPVHARRRGRRAVGAGGLDRRSVAPRPALVPELPGRDVGALRRRRARAPRRPELEAPLSIGAEVERQLAELRLEETEDGEPELRTSVMTHVAWAPPAWAAAARRTLAGLEERHPSRTILLLPEPRRADGVDVSVSMRCFAMPGVTREVCSEVIELRIGGARARAPASVVQPLLISDLPTFCRWRGLPPWGKPELEQLVDVCDRLVVDSGEWRGLPKAYAQLAKLFDRIAVSDIAWGRGLPWRARLAALWPGIADAKRISVTGPKADALLLAGWLRSRLGTRLTLTHRSAAELERVLVDGEPVEPPRGGPPSASDLLSAELDVFGRDPVYEASVSAAR